MMIWVAAERYSKTADKRMERAVKEIREKNGDQGSVLLVRTSRRTTNSSDAPNAVEFCPSRVAVAQRVRLMKRVPEENAG